MSYVLYITILISISVSMAQSLWYASLPIDFKYPSLPMDGQDNDDLLQDQEINEEFPGNIFNIHAKNAEGTFPYLELFGNQKNSVVKKDQAKFWEPNEVSFLAPNQARFLMLDQVEPLASNQAYFWGPNEDRFLALNQAKILELNEEKFLAPYQDRFLRSNEDRYLEPSEARFLMPDQDSIPEAKFINPMMILKKKFMGKKKILNKAEQKTKTCTDKGGTLFDGECYQYIDQQLSFDQARKHCMAKEGDLWTPNFTDPYLFNKLMERLPILASAPNKAVWIGAMLVSGRFIDVNKIDVTDTYFFRVNFILSSNTCSIYSFYFGYQLSAVDNCQSTTHTFICEYPIKGKPAKKDHILFNKFRVKW